MEEIAAGAPNKKRKEPEEFRWLTGWSRLILDMFAITFGVLLALALTEWRQRAEKEAFIEKSLSQIEEEIVRNFEKINEAYEYREKLYPYLLGVEKGDILSTEIPFRGTQGPRLERAAYEVALSNAVFSEIDSERAQKIVAIYLDFTAISETHELYRSGVPTLLFSADNSNDPRVGTYLKQAFEDFIFVEGMALDKIVETNRAEASSATTFEDVEKPERLIDRLSLAKNRDK